MSTQDCAAASWQLIDTIDTRKTEVASSLFHIMRALAVMNHHACRSNFLSLTLKIIEKASLLA